MATPYQYWTWLNVISPEESKDLVNFINLNYDKVEPDGLGATTEEGVSKKNLNCKQISWCKIKDKLNFILDRAYSINNNHFGFSLYPKNDHDIFNLNTYNENVKASYDWHVDESRDLMQDIKLTVLINLSTQSYKGGKFSMFHTNEFSIPDYDKPGSMIMFKSYMNHKVSPVTSGERISLAGFLKGPKFI